MALAWFPCYVNDLLGSLSWRCMTPAQRGAYWQLICCQMQAEDGTLPDGIAMLSRLADLDLSGENSVVLDKFPPTESGKRANLRAYSEWLKRQDISEKRSNAGAIGGASKKQLPEQKRHAHCVSLVEKFPGPTSTGGSWTSRLWRGWVLFDDACKPVGAHVAPVAAHVLHGDEHTAVAILVPSDIEHLAHVGQL